MQRSHVRSTSSSSSIMATRSPVVAAIARLSADDRPGFD
jgi:hypothetical protein